MSGTFDFTNRGKFGTRLATLEIVNMTLKKHRHSRTPKGGWARENILLCESNKHYITRYKIILSYLNSVSG